MRNNGGNHNWELLISLNYDKEPEIDYCVKINKYLLLLHNVYVLLTFTYLSFLGYDVFFHAKRERKTFIS